MVTNEKVNAVALLHLNAFEDDIKDNVFTLVFNSSFEFHFLIKSEEPGEMKIIITLLLTAVPVPWFRDAAR